MLNYVKNIDIFKYIVIIHPYQLTIKGTICQYDVMQATRRPV